MQLNAEHTATNRGLEFGHAWQCALRPPVMDANARSFDPMCNALGGAGHRNIKDRGLGQTERKSNQGHLAGHHHAKRGVATGVSQKNDEMPRIYLLWGVVTKSYMVLIQCLPRHARITPRTTALDTPPPADDGCRPPRSEPFARSATQPAPIEIWGRAAECT